MSKVVGFTVIVTRGDGAQVFAVRDDEVLRIIDSTGKQEVSFPLNADFLPSKEKLVVTLTAYRRVSWTRRQIATISQTLQRWRNRRQAGKFSATVDYSKSIIKRLNKK